MAHITFIHGISNKPAQDKLLKLWLRSLAEKEGIDLGTSGVSSSMVYWADVFYPEPLTDAMLESAQDFENNAAVAVQEGADPDMSWRQKITGEEKAMVDSLAAKLSFDVLVDDAFAPPESEADRNLERIPLPLSRNFIENGRHWLIENMPSRKLRAFTKPPSISYPGRDKHHRRLVTAASALAKAV